MSVVGRMSRSRLAHVVVGGVLMSAMTLTDGGGLLGRSPARASELSSEERTVIDRSAWGTYAWSAPIEGYEEIPLSIVTGYPMTDVTLGTPPAKCEARAAGTWFSYAVEEGIIPSYWPGETDSSPEDPGSSTYRSPTLARSANPPYRSQYGDAKESAEVKPAGGTGPVFTSQCPSPLLGKASARHFNLDVNGMQAQQAAADTEQHFDTARRVIVSTTESRMTGVHLGALSINEIASLLTVELPPDAKPTISYRLTLSGISGEGSNKSEGGQENGVYDQGLVLSGKAVGGADLVAQFNKQLADHQDVVKAMGRYGVRILAPNVEEGRCWGRGSATTGCQGWYLAEGPVLDAGFGPAARQQNIGQYQALRMASTRFFGHYSDID